MFLKRDTGLRFIGFFRNMVLIRKIIVIHPLHNETGNEHNRDDKTSLLMITAMIFKH